MRDKESKCHFTMSRISKAADTLNTAWLQLSAVMGSCIFTHDNLHTRAVVHPFATAPSEKCNDACFVPRGKLQQYPRESFLVCNAKGLQQPNHEPSVYHSLGSGLRLAHGWRTWV